MLIVIPLRFSFSLHFQFDISSMHFNSGGITCTITECIKTMLALSWLTYVYINHLKSFIQLNMYLALIIKSNMHTVYYDFMQEAQTHFVYCYYPKKILEAQQNCKELNYHGTLKSSPPDYTGKSSHGNWTSRDIQFLPSPELELGCEWF